MTTRDSQNFALPAPKRFGVREGLRSLAGPFAVYMGLAFLIGWSVWPEWYRVKNETIITLGLFALWRYGWLLINYIRALIYNKRDYPRMQRKAQSLPEHLRYPDHVFFLIPSFKEEPWISLETMRSILANLSNVPCRATLVVATGSDQDDAVISEAFESHPVHTKVELVLQRQSQGKRIAMGHALRCIARRYADEHNSVTVFMDGDSRIEPSALARTLPLFCANPKLGAVTTNEIAYLTDKTRASRQWFNLKMGQRHVLFQSHSLSRRVLTLTGRFSLIRTSIICEESFIRQIENDHLTHWMHGRFRFLMGDDKSTWYELLKDRWEMIYTPDVICYSLESRQTPFMELSMSLPYRWYGNTLRNNSRALSLGPGVSGWFIWLAILDQRLSMWTSLVGITGAIILATFVSYIYLPFYLAWALMVRTIQLSVTALGGHPVGMLSLPLMLWNQWVGAFVKMHAFFHLSRQRWFKGGSNQAGQKGSKSETRGIRSPLAPFMPKYHMVISMITFLFTMVLAHEVLTLPHPRLLQEEAEEYEVEAVLRGVWPNDGADDAFALQVILNSLPLDKPCVVTLPAGNLDFKRPVEITRGNVRIIGAGERLTNITSHLQQPAGAAIKVAGKRNFEIGRLALASSAGWQMLEMPEPVPFLAPGDLLLVRTPNDRRFLDELGSEVWEKEYPYLRQTIVKVSEIEENIIRLTEPLLFRLPAVRTEVYKITPVRDVTLANFTITQDVPDGLPADVVGVYENLYPDFAVDSILLEWTENVRLQNLRFGIAGRHPLHVESSYNFQVANCRFDGAWNKGPGGNGYLRIARSHKGLLENLTVRNLRHITLQWSSSQNRFDELVTAVDVNFHGGFSHNNLLTNVEFHLPDTHPWPPVFRTPSDASWAPPDGPNNQVFEKAQDVDPNQEAQAPALTDA